MHKKIIIEMIDKTGRKPGSTVIISREAGKLMRDYTPAQCSKDRVQKLFLELGLMEIWQAKPIVWFISNPMKESK